MVHDEKRNSSLTMAQPEVSCLLPVVGEEPQISGREPVAQKSFMKRSECENSNSVRDRSAVYWALVTARLKRLRKESEKQIPRGPKSARNDKNK